MFSQFLKQADRLVHSHQTNTVVVPAFRIDLNILGNTHKEFVKRPSKRNVIIPGGTCNELIRSSQAVPVHQKASGETVVGLGDLIHQEHLGPGIHIKIILVVFGIEVLQCIPRFQKISFNCCSIHALRFGFLADILYGHPVVVAAVAGNLSYFKHAGDRKLLLPFFQIIVVFQRITAVRGVIVIFRGDEIISEILSIHPEIGKSRLHSDPEFICQIHGDLVAHQRVVQEVRNEGPLRCLDAFHQFHFLGILITGIFINGDVIGFFRKSPGTPGGVASSLDTHILADIIKYDRAITLGIMILIGVHRINSAQ